MYKFVILILFLILFGSCCPEDTFVSTRNVITTGDVAYVRFVHAATKVGGVRFVAGNDYFQAEQSYMKFFGTNNEAKYYPIDTNIHEFKITNSGATLVKKYVALKKGAYHTLYFYQYKGVNKLLLTDDSPNESPTQRQTKVRIVNLSDDLPPLEIRLDSDTGEVLFKNIPPETASEYAITTARTGTGLYLMNATNKEYLYAIFKPYLVLFGSAVITAVITGNKDAYLGDSLLSFSLFQDGSLINNQYGSLPSLINFYGVRLVNLINDNSKPDFRVSLAFFDPDAQYAKNENFRRYIPGFLLGNHAPHAHWVNDSSQWHRYFFYFPSFKNLNRFRVEEDVLGIFDYGKQPVLVPEQKMNLLINKKYCFTVYGKYTSDTSKHSVKLSVIDDHIPRPPVNNMTIRFMHTSYGGNENKKFALKINSQVTPFVKYGETHTANFITISNTQPVFEVIDETGKVVLKQSDLKLMPNEGYTIIFTKSYDTITDELIKLSHDSKTIKDRN